MNFENIFYTLMQDEGLWLLTNDPDDRGGETWSGISRKSHSQWAGWPLIDAAKAEGGGISKSRNFESVKRLTIDFYEETFWLPIDCDKLPEGLAYELFEQAVNLGTGRAVRHLQTVLNALNRVQVGGALEYGDDLKVDGAYGQATRARLFAALEKGRASAVQNGINGLQCSWYVTLGNNTPSQRRFTNGWLSKRGRGEICKESAQWES